MSIQQTDALSRFPNDATTDGTLLTDVQSFGDSGLLELSLAVPQEDAITGRYFLARCGAQSLEQRWAEWSHPLRLPLYAYRCSPSESDETIWRLSLPPVATPSTGWIRALQPGSTLNLMGPFGNPVELGTETRNLLLLADAARILKILPLADQILDRGGRITLVLLERSDDRIRSDLLSHLPIAAEVHFASINTGWASEIPEMLRWADQLCAALPDGELVQLSAAIRQSRLRWDEGFSLCYPDSDLICGAGACLACVVPTSGGGYTRACVHGPVFDIRSLAVRE